ncbi:hypothetical protein ACI0FS_23875, partial [Ochrobactrum quorumnocens]|uniref:hypothetical protein n=1 Tax=Ochrobactrum quorumnocens TaxID=271865 RepID=UPI003853103D
AARGLAQINSKDHNRHWLVPFFFTHASILTDAAKGAGLSIRPLKRERYFFIAGVIQTSHRLFQLKAF